MRGFSGCFQWILLAVLTSSAWGSENPPVAKYVFLFIGDGMSVPQRMMAEEFQQEVHKKGLVMNSFPYQVLTKTPSANSFITDSAASGTAIACGEKTNNGRIGTDPTGKRLESIARTAHKSGRRVGILTSVTLNHATPASFYGYNDSRGNYYSLGLDLIHSGFEFFAGGAIDRYNDEKDGKFQGNIYELAQKEGYQVFHEKSDLSKIEPGMGKVILCRKDGALPYAIDAEEGDLELVELTRKGIEMLDNPQGFFMMVEGGKIDWMCHANDAGTVLRETIHLDEAIQVAYEFAQKHPDETLIVVTGDHETGGLTLGFAGTGYQSYIHRLQFQKCSQDVFRSRLQKELEKLPKDAKWEAIQPLLTESFGLAFTEDRENPMRVRSAERKMLEEAFQNSFQEKKISASPLTTTTVRLFNNKAGLAWTTNAHTALPVNTTAYGVGAEVFSGMIDNTDIAKKLRPILQQPAVSSK
ncbi:MAG: alkaline phosphatase [Planctomycetia bacterium]|nr:alkaline phosphatase [Planctomycetia bacterium]